MAATARSSGQDSIFGLIGRLCAVGTKPRLRIIYLTTRITGKSRAMAVNGDGTLIAGILEINLFRQRRRSSTSLHLRPIAHACVCVSVLA